MPHGADEPSGRVRRAVSGSGFGHCAGANGLPMNQTRIQSGSSVDAAPPPTPTPTPTPTPRVSVGLPVYNGARYLEQAIDSILAQTFTDFELILCDNASTDATTAICARYVAADRRVRYHRNETNLGAAPNFNKVFTLGRGDYFKWAAYDDILEPDYLAECVAALDRDPEAVLAHTATTVIDPDRRTIPIGPGIDDTVQWRGRTLRRDDLYDPPRDLSEPDLHKRLTAFLLNTNWSFEIFGLMRTSALRRSPLHLSFYGSDKVLLASLVMQGTFVEIPRRLFLRRYHESQSSNQDNAQQAVWMDSTAGPNAKMPAQAQCLLAYLRVVNHAGLKPLDRCRAYCAIARWVVWLGQLIYRHRHQRGLLYRLRRAWHESVGAEPPRNANNGFGSRDDDEVREHDESTGAGRRDDTDDDATPRGIRVAPMPVLRSSARSHVR